MSWIEVQYLSARQLSSSTTVHLGSDTIIRLLGVTFSSDLSLERHVSTASARAQPLLLATAAYALSMFT